MVRVTNSLVCSGQMPASPRHVTDLEEFVYFAKVDSLLGVQLVNVTDIAIHEIQAKPHHLEETERLRFISMKSTAHVKGSSPSLSMREDHFRLLYHLTLMRRLYDMCTHLQGRTW